MFVGRTLYLLGMAFVLFSIFIFIVIPFANTNGDLTIPFFALLNGFIAMGVGDLVMERRREKMNKD